MINNKKAQLGMIEFRFFFIGLIIGLIAAFVLAYLANHGTLPFRMELLCTTPAN